MVNADFFPLFSRSFLFFYLVSFVCGLLGAWTVKNYASKFGLVDYPNNRSSHNQPIPKGGGIGILIAFALSSLFLNVPLSFWLSTVFVALISFLGDRFEIPHKLRLIFQFIGAIVLLSGISYDSDQNKVYSFIVLGLMSIFVVGTANFYNFMDGINGIAGITGGIGFGLLGLYAFVWFPINPITILAICISFACLGFLPFNIPKAKVFMGDIGSILLGFVFAGMIAVLSKNILDFICLSAFLFPFYADELTTMFLRLKDRENLAVPHRRHFYQFLANERQVSHSKISIGYGLAQIMVGLSLLAVKPFGMIPVLLMLIVYFSGFILLTFNFRKQINLKPKYK